MRQAFLDTLTECLERDPSIMLLTADTGFHVFDDFQHRYPDNYLNVGISEAAMIGMAAGLALAGRKVFVYAIAPFVTLRCLEQIRVDLCYQNLPVKVVGVGAGLTYGPAGPTHHAIEDIAVMSCLPNMSVFCPGDPWETQAVFRSSLNLSGPCYIRLGKSGEPCIHDTCPDFEPGRGIRVRSGRDLAIMATGNMLSCGGEVARQLLAEHQISAELVSMVSVKPVDRKAICAMAEKFSLLVTLEEHSVIGGLGSTVANVLAEEGKTFQLLQIGIPDSFARVAGSQDYLRGCYGLQPSQVVERILARRGADSD